MELVQKNRIIKRFLIESSENPVAVNLKDEDLALYSELSALLEHIELHQNSLFNLETVETDPSQWREFCDIIKYSSIFEPGSPPLLKNVCLKKAEKGIRYTLNAHDINALPKDDYYTRPVSVLSEEDPELNDLIVNSRTKLYALIQTFPEITAFDASNSAQIAIQILQLQEITRLVDNNSEKEKVQKRLTILQDLNKLNELKQIRIPQDNSSVLIYCTLAENIGGVTEKIPLVILKRVKRQLRNLCERSADLNVNDYYTEREYYKLCTQAIIKLPKRGNVKEIQHEAMALNISRLLGLDTSVSTSIAYNNHPALFIPFSDIRLLSDFSSGKTFSSWLIGKTYSHYSTIKPVGEGIEADCFINDFGNTLGFFYICSDTDAIGGNCQNKALRQAKSLFIFDQSLMDTDKFILDSRLCLIPGEFLRKHTRHGIGRNRTIIEDSSLNSKFESIMQLKILKDKLIQYANHVAWQHRQKAAQIQLKLLKPHSNEQDNQLTTQLSNLMILEKDAELLKTKIQERIAAIENILPQTTGNVSSLEIRQALVFEKLMHNPVLFSDDGRPYRNPWTYRQLNPIKKVDDLGNGCLQLTFNDKVSSVMVEFIKRHSRNDSIILTSAKTITISKEQLTTLNEDLLHPEQKSTLDSSINYLDAMDLAVIKEAYGAGNRSQIIHTITSYCTKMNCDTVSADEKIACIVKTEKQLKAYLRNAYDKGFCKHVLKKFYFDMQLQLQKLIPALETLVKLNDAFVAALKLDRVSEFNTVVIEAIKQNKIKDSHFTCFLDECIQRIKNTKNYIEAQKESLELSNAAEKTIHKLQMLSKSFTVLLSASQIQHNQLNKVDPIINNKPNLENEFHVFIKKSLSTVSAMDNEGINEQNQIAICY